MSEECPDLELAPARLSLKFLLATLFFPVVLPPRVARIADHAFVPFVGRTRTAIGVRLAHPIGRTGNTREVVGRSAAMHRACCR